MEGKEIYVAFFKPYAVLTAFTDPDGRDTLKNYIDLPGIYPAGRLDYDSEGLLLLTDDGPLAHRLTDPDYNHPKTYLVQVEGVISQEAVTAMEQGVIIKGGYQTRRSQVMVVPEPELPPRGKPVTPHGPTSWIRVVLREGKKRQVRQMTAAVGFPTLRLLRVAIGPVSLGNLQPGEWRYLSNEEIQALQTSLRTPRGQGSKRLNERENQSGRRPSAQAMRGQMRRTRR
jgi:23S rRNA pseudouridine2457 synthase